MFTTIYIFLAILVGVYANSKGRSGFGFFLIAALLSPLIGFVIALVISPISSKVEQNALDVGDMKKCPSCAELVKTEAKLCKHCRTELA
jgi:phosphotransferase system  glucose/maltose/N-acetylglucosamine-specific IIC component